MFTRVGKFRRAARLSPPVPRVGLGMVLGLAGMAMSPVRIAMAEHLSPCDLSSEKKFKSQPFTDDAFTELNKGVDEKPLTGWIALSDGMSDAVVNVGSNRGQREGGLLLQ